MKRAEAADMKKTLLTITALALLAGALPLIQTGCTNRPGSSTEAAAKPYPLDYCLVSGDKLGEMGKPFVFEYKGQEVKLCCKDCKAKFDKEPAKYIKMIEEADAKAKK